MLDLRYTYYDMEIPVLYEDVLEATQLRRLSSLLDHSLIETALLRADRGSLQAEADLLAGVSSKDEWAGASLPSLILAPGTRWFEWAIPGKGSVLGLLVETEPQVNGGVTLRALGFMGRTLMLYFEVAFSPLGEPSPSTFVEAAHQGRVKFREYEGYTESLEPDDAYNETFAWTFMVPLITAYMVDRAGDIESVQALLRCMPKKMPLPQALSECRRLAPNTHTAPWAQPCSQPA